MKEIGFYDDLAEYESDGDESQKDFLKKWKSVEIGAMIKELDKARMIDNDLPDDERKETNTDTIDLLRLTIAYRLGLYPAVTLDVFRDELNDSLKDLDSMRAEIKELRSIQKRHNHEYAGTYTSPARWVS